MRDENGKFPPIMHMGIFVNPGSFEVVPILLVTDLDVAREIYNDLDRFPKSHVYVHICDQKRWRNKICSICCSFGLESRT